MPNHASHANIWQLLTKNDIMELFTPFEDEENPDNGQFDIVFEFD